MPIKWAWLIFMFVVVQCSVCSPKGPHWIKPPKPIVEPNTNGVMRIMGRWGFAHACPVEGVVLTAAHVVNPFHGVPTMNAVLVGYAWSDGNGNQGMLEGVGASRSRDLGLLELKSGEPSYYRHATKEPEVGDLLHWLEYNSSNRETVYTRRIKRAKLLRRVSGHLILDQEPQKGASGSCVLNMKGEVVGILTRIRGTDDGKTVGVAVSIAGPWWKQ